MPQDVEQTQPSPNYALEPLRDQDPALVITNHAITRYVQRILGHTVPGPFATTRDEARAHCIAAGLTIREARQQIWTPGLAAAVAMKVGQVDTGRLLAIIDQTSQTVRTILPPRTRNGQRFRPLSDREMAAACKRRRRRMKRKPVGLSPRDLNNENEGT